MAMRHIAAIACALSLAACAKTQEAPASSAAPTPLNVLVVGDSFSSPTPGLTMWPDLVAAQLKVNVFDHAVPGSGYIAQGIGATPARFIRQLSENPVPADVVLIFGSTNDKTASTADIEQAAIETIDVANAVYPDAKIIVAGPQSAANNAPVDRGEYDNRDAVLAATQQAPVDYWDDTLTIFNTGTAGPDNFHPNQEGQQLLADHFASIIREVCPL